ncbi:MAG: hypothetical protein JO339_25800 [Alphaproteobacteria bacterium]|nr:hypothetical protein [Alphaproteobacteria bacterium]
MRRLILSITLGLLAAAACTYTSAYTTRNSTYHSVGGVLSADDFASARKGCDERLGDVQHGYEPSAAYKQCMLAQGWQLDCTIPPDAYPDPHNACRPCRNFLVLGVMGRECG